MVSRAIQSSSSRVKISLTLVLKTSEILMDHLKHRQTRKQNTAKLGNKIPPNSETKYRQTRKKYYICTR